MRTPITVSFEFLHPVTGDVLQEQVTAHEEFIRLVAHKLAATDDSFCIRSEDAMYCRCKQWGLL